MGFWRDNLGVALGYWLLAFATSVFLSAYGVFPSPFWPSASVALAAALLGGRRVWPGIFLGSCLSNWVIFNAPFWLAVGISICNVIAPAVAAAYILRFTQTTQPFFRVSHVAHFIVFGTILHGLMAATGGVGLSLAAGVIPAANGFTAWWHWALSDAWGTFLFGPALLLWWSDRRVTLSRTQWYEGSTLVVLTLGFAAGIFWGIQGQVHPFVGLPYLLLAPLMWFTVRMSMRAGVTLLSVVALIALLGTIAKNGPFLVLGAEHPLADVGLMVLALGMSVLAVGALVSERRSAEVRLWEMRETLEQNAQQRTVELHRRATEDRVTGLANRAYFFELGEFTLQHAKRTGRPLIALSVGFDEADITTGEDHYQAAVSRLAEACRASLRDGDLLGRVARDHVAILLTNVDANEAESVGNRILANLRQFSLATDFGTGIGWAGLVESDKQLADLLHRAETAMLANRSRATQVLTSA